MEAAAPPLTAAAASAALSPPPTPSVAATYPDSGESSPRSRHCEPWDSQPPPPLTSSSSSSKIRLMCSYGGQIVPRPHDPFLCYLGGTTRIVVVDRHTTLSSLHSKLSSSLFDGRPFSLKYQLPNEDLESLISVSTDEDLDNMIDEYDRLLHLSSSSSASAASKHPPRLRLFLFPSSKSDSASSLGALVDDSKSESWFVDALNGTGILPRGLSPDSSADVNSLLGLAAAAAASAAKPPESPSGKRGQEIHSVPDSPLMTSSSFGSTSSATCLSNLPPIRVRVEEPRLAGLEEHFAQINVGDDRSNWGVSGDEERPEQGLPTNFRKPPLPPPKLIQNELPSDSVSASSDVAGAALNSQQKAGFYQDTIASSVSAASFVSDLKPDLSDPTYRIPVQLPERQFVPATPHYIHHHTSGPVPISSYYQMHHPHPMYFVPVGQSQAYNLHMRPSLSDPTPISATKPPLPTSPIIPAAAPKPEPAATLYRTAATTPAAQPIPGVAPVVNLSNQQLQQQQQYVGYHQLHHPGQSPGPAASFAYEFADPLQAQVYYAQPAATLPSQYQTVTSAVMIPEILLPVHTNVDTLLNKTSQAL